VQYRSAKLIEYLDRQASRVLVGLQHKRRDGADKHGFGYAASPITADVARDFAAASGVTNVDRAAQVKCCDEFG
jgi:hypothetical protein